MHPALAIGIAYVAGSIPFAYLAGRWIKGIDLRTIGSGNLGATNVFRNLGPEVGAVVLLLDALKGALPVALLPSRVVAGGAGGSELWWGLAIGVAAILGHWRSMFLLWRGGGKGVATSAGVFSALAPAAVGIAFVAFAAVMWRSRIVSLSSISAALVLPLAVAFTLGAGSPVFVVAAAIGLFVIWSHRTNIERLRAGTEPRLSRGTTEATR